MICPSFKQMLAPFVSFSLDILEIPSHASYSLLSPINILYLCSILKNDKSLGRVFSSWMSISKEVNLDKLFNSSRLAFLLSPSTPSTFPH
ncbi:hypothetical protein CICLE_v10004056mg [Citrus x clementina]|uniref:Uncharacterized protein n=1 Tax=Citrus clementina TaxID=85681 RepID=V4SZW6_CITCL|nr:hypothetical protein CICLE_v10004056mg [Citrus x clementina]